MSSSLILAFSKSLTSMMMKRLIFSIRITTNHGIVGRKEIRTTYVQKRTG